MSGNSTGRAFVVTTFGESHGPALGGIVRVGEKSELLRIAYASAAIAAVNTTIGTVIHSRLRSAGLWVFASGGMVQLVLLAAAIVAFSAA